MGTLIELNVSWRIKNFYCYQMAVRHFSVPGKRMHRYTKLKQFVFEGIFVSEIDADI